MSFFEWVQNLQNFRWEEEEVNKRLDRAMTEAFSQIWEISRQKKLPLRTAAFVKALQSVTRAHLHSEYYILSFTPLCEITVLLLLGGLGTKVQRFVAILHLSLHSARILPDTLVCVPAGGFD